MDKTGASLDLIGHKLAPSMSFSFFVSFWFGLSNERQASPRDLIAVSMGTNRQGWVGRFGIALSG